MSDGAARGRPRRAETDERLKQATVELLRERGPAGVTIEAVASRSGLARTTIYRRFDTRRQLLAAAIDPVVDKPLPPADLSLEGKVRWVLAQVVDLLDTDLGRGVVAALITDSDPEFTGALRHALERRLAALQAQIQTDIDTGRVARHVEPDALVGLLLGAYLSQVLRHGEPGTDWMDSTVDLLTTAIDGRSANP